MKKIAVLLACIGFVSALAWAAQPGRENHDAEIAIQRLNKRVTALEQKLGEVQRELKEVKERPPLITVPAPTPKSESVPTQPGTGRLPPYGKPDGEGEIWREGHINGWKFYVIPLSAEEAKANMIGSPIEGASSQQKTVKTVLECR